MRYKKVFRITLLGILAIIITIIGGIVVVLNPYGILYKQNWRIVKQTKNALPWVPFYWSGDSISGRYFDKSAMYVPVTVENLPNKFICQFDLGANTKFYANDLSLFLNHYSILKEKVSHSLRCKCLNNLHVSLGNEVLQCNHVEILKNFGQEYTADAISDTSNTYQLGSIGVDMCHDKVLIIDYPKQRLCINNNIPQQYKNVRFYDFTLNMNGFVILKMEYKGHVYNVLYDTGSSLFALMAFPHAADKLSTEINNDSLSITSWGQRYMVMGRPLNGPFTIAGHTFKNTKMYIDNRLPAYKEMIGCTLLKMDAITGNNLFLNNIVIIDFKNRKIAVI